MEGDKYKNMKFKRDSVCRLCIRETTHLIDIFKHDNKRNLNHISQYIQRYFDVDIKQDDYHSRFICGACWCLLDFIIKKRNTFKENDSKLQNTPVEKKLVLPQITGLLLSDSVKQIFAENSRIILPDKYWLINFDAKVDLSTCKLSVDLVKKSPKNDNSQIENKRASISKSGAIMKGKEGKNPVWSKNYMNGSKNGSVGSCSDKEPITEEEMEC